RQLHPPAHCLPAALPLALQHPHASRAAADSDQQPRTGFASGGRSPGAEQVPVLLRQAVPARQRVRVQLLAVLEPRGQVPEKALLTRLGVLGWPVRHSRSPAIHNAALAAAGLGDWRYQLLPVPPGLLAEVVAALPGAGFRGVNVTIPHKQAALALA